MRSPSRLALAQHASLIGLWGLTFLAWHFASPAVLIDRSPTARGAWMHKPWIPPALAVAVLIAMGGYGTARLRQEPVRLVETSSCG